MAENSSAEKKHAPTERRLHQAAERGDIHRSYEFQKAAVIVITVVAAIYVAAGLCAKFMIFFARCLNNAGTENLDIAHLLAVETFKLFFPLLLLIAMVSFMASIVSGGWIFVVNLLVPDFSKITSFSGINQIFSKTGILENGKSILKFILISAVGGGVVFLKRGDFVSMITVLTPQPWLVFMIVVDVVKYICIAIVILAICDFGLKIFEHRQKLKMSDEDIRQEMKEAVGNPQVKSRQRALAYKMARARQMRRIPEASVVVTNPTHYACAIRYHRKADRAPVLLAKGADLMAAEIVSRARGYGIPVVEFPPLARAVFRHVEPDEYIPIALYRACAEVLAYVWKLQKWRSYGGNKPQPPKAPQEEIDLKGNKNI